MEKKDILESLKKLREGEKRKFEQTFDLIVNLKDFDIKKDSVNLFLNVPHQIKENQIAGFLNEKSNYIDTIPKNGFTKFKDKKEIKKLIKKYDFFVASANLMPAVATTFGRYLGPVGKMPSPQFGIVREETEKELTELKKKCEKIVRIKSKQPSLKFSIGKENMDDDKIAENIMIAYNAILNALPKKKENLKNIMVKLTMTKPVKINN